jgi:glycosyltransferase involved in cell wall biosynthesis
MNQFLYEQLRQSDRPGKIIWAPPGVDVSFWRPSAYHTGGYILTVSRLDDPRKNVRMLLEAYGILRGTFSQTPRLVLAGRNALRAADQAYLESMGLNDQVEVIVDVSAEQLRNLYQNASLFVLSSNEEGFGIVLLEAMSCGLPVISTECGGPSTAVTSKTGLLTPVGDAQALALAIRTLLQDAQLRLEMGWAGRQRAVECFSIEVAGQVFLSVYEKLLNGRQL